MVEKPLLLKKQGQMLNHFLQKWKIFKTVVLKMNVDLLPSYADLVNVFPLKRKV